MGTGVVKLKRKTTIYLCLYQTGGLVRNLNLEKNEKERKNIILIVEILPLVVP